MTLVLGAACRYKIFHASDRLTTITPTRKNPDKAWDIHSNKTVIVVGSGCWLVIGYTGLAYLDGVPTDEFIANAIAGGELGSGIGMWHPGRPLHYREISRSIEAAMHEAYGRLPVQARKYPTIVSAVGLQNRKHKTRPVSFHAVVSADGVVHEERARRDMPVHGYDLYEPLGSANASVFHWMRARLQSEGGESPEAFRDIMMDAVVETGKISDVVGEDVMGVILEPLDRKISVHFRSATPDRQLALVQATHPTLEERAKVPTVPTPWILTPGMFFAPAIGTGGWQMDSGIEIDLTGFDYEPTPGPMTAFWGKHPRRAQPK
ncbi:hypothetical protein QN239_26780 [Mycolicibacterium sp. Y3]